MVGGGGGGGRFNWICLLTSLALARYSMMFVIMRDRRCQTFFFFFVGSLRVWSSDVCLVEGGQGGVEAGCDVHGFVHLKDSDMFLFFLYLLASLHRVNKGFVIVQRV